MGRKPKVPYDRIVFTSGKQPDVMPQCTLRAIQLNGHGDDYCPRCGRGILIRDKLDIACLACGWRQTCYFGKNDIQLPDYLIARLIYNRPGVL